MATATAVPSTHTAPPDPSRGSQRRRRPRRNPNAPADQQEERQAQVQAPTQAPALAQSQRGGRSGRGRGGARGGHNEATRPLAAQGDTPNQDAPPSANRGGGRGGRARGRGPRFGPRMAAGGRQFGGQLTVEDDDSEASFQASSNLQADAPTFQPGQPVAPRKRQPREKKPQAPKSNAADIATRTHEDIDNGHYECAICTEEIRRHARGVWSCRTCWTVFHLGCIKKWSTNEGSAAARQQAQDGELPPPRQWRCPGCNLPKDVLPKNFHCWCEKELDPKSLSGLPPFSCGQTCARPRVLPKSCPHPCPVTCHAGPCPPCGLMGPTKPCFCGKKSTTRRCIDTDYEHGWGCGEVCGELMACGEHRCSRPCHDGPCGSCEVRVPARCYCGQIQKGILCRDRAGEKQSRQAHAAADGTVALEEWIGTFECPNICSRPFDCGKHTCEKPCHQQDSEPTHCPRSPDIVTHCPCGKTHLNQMTDATRTTCEDPIPNCTRPCHKLLDCGHQCERLCHQGDCSACFQRVTISCRCGRTTSNTICHQGTVEPPQCMRICRVSLNCGRHECGERCCAGERKAAERQANRRKARPLDAAPRRPGDNFEAEHICTRSCGRQLKCGNPEHRCEELCHKGPCGTCREAIFDELSCHCGRTVLQPPLPCGTKPPPCRFACERPKDCGHPQMAHNCHGDEENCPKCPFLTTKSCLCGKNVLKNQPCWLSDVRCGDICGKTLRCGTHKCQKQCHRSGECEEPCKQPCGKELSTCGHPCMSSCHFPSVCKEDKPCQHKIFITCECQRIKQEAKCAASRQSDGNTKKTLKCDEECARLERNHKLALALNVDPEHQTDHVPYSTDTLNMYQQNSTWAAGQEKQLRLFAADEEAKRLRFKPMQSHQRAFVHSLAEDFGFDTESMDPEPHRHVCIFKTPRFVMAPMKTLAECARTRQVQRPIPTPAATATLRPKPSNTTADPYNAFLVTNPRFALTVEEVSSIVKTVLAKTSFRLELEVNFLPSEAVTLKPPLVARLNMEEREMQKLLESIQEPLSQAFAAQKIGKVQLARLDSSLNILRKESDVGPGSGWSTVAAAKGAPLRQVPRGMTFGNKGGFAVLSLSSKKKKEKPAEVVEDWEAAEEQEEEKEKEVSGATSAVVSENEDAGVPSQPRSVVAEGPSDEVLIPMTPGTARWADMDDE
jgi:transcriptional repressor NF-X1